MAANLLTASIVAILCVQNNKCADDNVTYLLTEQNIHAKFEHPICGKISKDLYGHCERVFLVGNCDKSHWNPEKHGRNMSNFIHRTLCSNGIYGHDDVQIWVTQRSMGQCKEGVTRVR